MVQGELVRVFFILIALMAIFLVEEIEAKRIIQMQEDVPQLVEQHEPEVIQTIEPKRTIATERPGHRMMETWHPLGVIGIISAFNFPVAVWAWNAALALVCGNSVVWKPSEKTPLTALAAQAVLDRALRRFGDAPQGLAQLLIGDRTVGEVLVDHPKVPLVSATGSTRMGRDVGPRLAKRFARAILELGGNNGGIVCPSADLDMALRAIAFGAMGTAGQPIRSSEPLPPWCSTGPCRVC